MVITGSELGQNWDVYQCKQVTNSEKTNRQKATAGVQAPDCNELHRKRPNLGSRPSLKPVQLPSLVILDRRRMPTTHAHVSTCTCSAPRSDWFAPGPSRSAFLFYSPSMCPCCSVCRTHTAHCCFPQRTDTRTRIHRLHAHRQRISSPQ